ncbi:MAG: hypothetical protein GTO18_02760 [Anaerolineales bacterium]|nr:hypothetical protein [Anaerolineales bacterium]
MDEELSLHSASDNQTWFFTLIRSAEEERNANLLIESLRNHGGALSHCPVFVFLLEVPNATGSYLGLQDVHPVPLQIKEPFQPYYFAHKVLACARAEEMAGEEVLSLVWLSTNTLITKPPTLFILADTSDAAFRPVHIQNIGSPADKALDGFWKEIYRTVGLEDVRHSVTSTIDQKTIRPYFNTHLFSIDPSKGVLQAWWNVFKKMAFDNPFQEEFCKDIDHQIFLHQAILSTLVVKMLDWDRILQLPSDYSYPLHFHQQMGRTQQFDALNEIVCPVYEGSFQYPETLNGLEVREPLKSWLENLVSTEGSN